MKYSTTLNLTPNILRKLFVYAYDEILIFNKYFTFRKHTFEKIFLSN